MFILSTSFFIYGILSICKGYDCNNAYSIVYQYAIYFFLYLCYERTSITIHIRQTKQFYILSTCSFIHGMLSICEGYDYNAYGIVYQYTIYISLYLRLTIHMRQTILYSIYMFLYLWYAMHMWRIWLQCIYDIVYQYTIYISFIYVV